MSEPGLGEVLSELAEIKAGIAALQTQFARLSLSKPIIGDELVWSHGRRPKFWRDLPVRQEAIALHRQMTIDAAFEKLRSKFGPLRCPSKSAIGRLWQAIDRQKRRRA